MKIKFKVIAIGEKFTKSGKTFKKRNPSLADDEKNIAHLVLANEEVEVDESVRTVFDTQIQRGMPCIRRRMNPKERLEWLRSFN